MNMMEDYLQTEFPQWNVWLTSISEQWAVIAVQGPKAREIIEPFVEGIDLDALVATGITHVVRTEPFFSPADVDVIANVIQLGYVHGYTTGQAVVYDNGGGTDIGYPRTVQRPDGKIVTVYYFQDQPKGDRYIAATIWEAGNQP